MKSKRSEKVELAEGMRIGLEIEGRLTYIAVIDSVTADSIVVDLLDDFDHQLLFDGVITMFVPHDAGLHYWPALAPHPPEGGRLTLTVAGPVQPVRRRRYQRYAVDLSAQIRSVRPGRRTQPAKVQVIDLSHGGAKVVGVTSAAIGDTVIFDVELGGAPLSATARVAMTYPDGEGRRVSHLAFSTVEEPGPAILGIDRYLRTLPDPQATATDRPALSPFVPFRQE